jgi:DNA-binding NarL/FixJ family response regulator
MWARVARFQHELEDYFVLSYPISRPGCFAKLTRAELDVAERVIAGATVRDIARAREVSERTASNQLGQIYAKLEIHSRQELLAIVSSSRFPESGLCEPSGSISRAVSTG